MDKKKYLAEINSLAGCGICWSVYLPNKSRFTYNECWVCFVDIIFASALVECGGSQVSVLMASRCIICF